MEVSSYNIEFGYELLSALPLAYEKHLAGELTETESAFDTSPLYYFSPKHTENNEPRSWYNTTKARQEGLPYTTIHRSERPALKFPPYKKQFANSEYKWEKPTLCICNRYNVEWDKKPINFFDEKLLDWMFSSLKKDYEIVYFAVDLPEELQDNAHSMTLNDIDICRKHGVKVFQEIKGHSWNESVLKVFANCEHYITMNGGYSILASFFTGTNIIYSKRGDVAQCKELDLKSFWRWYPNHNDQRTGSVESYEELKDKIQALYIDKLPVANIIMRTSKRPNYFSVAYRSVMKQDYQNINLVLVTDEQLGVIYTRQANARHIHITEKFEKPEKTAGEDYGIFFPQNRYLDIAQKKVEGYVIFLDDDDMFAHTNSVSEIMRHAKENQLTVWRVKFPDRILPKDSFGDSIKLYDITGIGFCYHTKYAALTDWSEWKRADYRTARNLARKLPVVWIDEVLTKLQGKAGMGMRIDTNLNKTFMKTVKILHPSAGKVGTFKRLDNAIADKVIKDGLAIHVKDLVEKLNAVQSTKVIEKPKPEENKMRIQAIEVNVKGDEIKKPSRTRKPRHSKSPKK